MRWASTTTEHTSVLFTHRQRQPTQPYTTDRLSSFRRTSVVINDTPARPLGNAALPAADTLHANTHQQSILLSHVALHSDTWHRIHRLSSSTSLFLALKQTRKRTTSSSMPLWGAGITLSACLLVGFNIHPSPNLWTWYSENEWTYFDAKRHKRCMEWSTLGSKVTRVRVRRQISRRDWSTCVNPT